MKFGPHYIYQCPNCNNLISRLSLMSGNTFGMKVYSDLKRDIPMIKEFANLTKNIDERKDTFYNNVMQNDVECGG